MEGLTKKRTVNNVVYHSAFSLLKMPDSNGNMIIPATAIELRDADGVRISSLFVESLENGGVRFEAAGKGYYELFGEHNKELLTEAEKPLPLVDSSYNQETFVIYHKNADGTVVVNINIEHYTGTIPANIYQTIATMPVGYRPSTFIFCSAGVATSGNSFSGNATINIDPDGSVRVLTSIANPKTIRATAVYKAVQ